MTSTAGFRRLVRPLPEAGPLDRIRAATSGPLIVSPRRGNAALQRQINSRLERFGFVVLSAPVDCRRSMRILIAMQKAFAGRNLYCVSLDGYGKVILAESAGTVAALLDVVLEPGYVPRDEMSREVLANLGLAKERGFRPASQRPPSGPALGRPANR
jgi:hypothetical protein